MTDDRIRDSIDSATARRLCEAWKRYQRDPYEHARIVWMVFGDVCNLKQCIKWTEATLTRKELAG